MCDILAISAGYEYTPQEYLPIFAEKGKENMNGWGIGFFRNGQALVEKSSEQVFSHQVHESFQRLARVIDSRIIISHIRCLLSGGSHPSHIQPYSLSFLDHAWLFAHVGLVEDIHHYRSVTEPRLEVEVYPARIFEYLRDRLLALLGENPYLSLYAALQSGIRQLLSEYAGNYTFLLANESVIFAFCNFRELNLLKKSESWGDILLLTSVQQGLSDEPWITIRPEDHSQGKLVVITGPDVVYLEDI